MIHTKIWASQKFTLTINLPNVVHFWGYSIYGTIWICHLVVQVNLDF